MQSVALSWLIYRLTGSALLLGTVGFAGQIPILLLTPFAGVLADRWPLRRLVVATQSLALVQAALLAVLTLTKVIAVWHIIALSAVMGIINAFDMPARQAFVAQMVEAPEDLGNAIALNSFLVNGARLVGPSLAGLLIAWVGEGQCFVINAISYIAVIVALLAMTVKPFTAPHPPPFLRSLAAGFGYALGFAPIRAVLMLLATASLLGMSYATVLPIFAGDILSGGPRTYGFLLGATGLGAVSGALYLASRRSVLGLGRVIVFGAGAFGAGLIAVSFARSLSVALPLMLLVGLGMMLQIASTNTFLQIVVEDDKRGRIMSLYTMAFIGMTPFGSLLAGAMAHSIGAPRTVLLGGLCCMIGALLFARRLPALRQLVLPIYARKGILPA